MPSQVQTLSFRYGTGVANRLFFTYQWNITLSFPTQSLRVALLRHRRLVRVKLVSFHTTNHEISVRPENLPIMFKTFQNNTQKKNISAPTSCLRKTSRHTFFCYVILAAPGRFMFYQRFEVATPKASLMGRHLLNCNHLVKSVICFSLANLNAWYLYASWTKQRGKH